MTTKKSILVVEDDKNISDLLICLFTEEDCKVVPAATVQSAISLVESVAFDLITLDLNLPDLSGIVFLQYLIKVTKAIPVVIISAIADRSRKEFDNIATVKKVISKPFNIDEIVELLNLV